MSTNQFDAIREARAKAQEDDAYIVLHVKDISVAGAPQGSSKDQLLSIVFNQRFDLLVNLPAAEKILLTEIGYAFSALALRQHVEVVLWKIDEYDCRIQSLQISHNKID